MTFRDWVSTLDVAWTVAERQSAKLAWDAQENKLHRISELVGDEAGPYLSTGELMDLIRDVLQD